MQIRTEIFNKNQIPDHLDEEIQKYVESIFLCVAPLMKDKKSLNFVMAAMNWVSFLCIKEFVSEAHQELAVLNQAKAILANLELFKDKCFMSSLRRGDSE
jgi:hypothetical protein